MPFFAPPSALTSPTGAETGSQRPCTRSKKQDACQHHANHPSSHTADNARSRTTRTDDSQLILIIPIHRPRPRPQRIRQPTRQRRVRLRRARAAPIRRPTVRIPGIPRCRGAGRGLCAADGALRGRGGRRGLGFGDAVGLRGGGSWWGRWARGGGGWWGWRGRGGFDFFEVGGRGPAGGGLVEAFAEPPAWESCQQCVTAALGECTLTVVLLLRDVDDFTGLQTQLAARLPNEIVQGLELRVLGRSGGGGWRRWRRRDCSPGCR